ncbi:MAG TPA: hypothetical protein VK934_12855 [Fimbriimonas sp.]|nr:hypothetical protein [Fimbriimonas sp.]
MIETVGAMILADRLGIDPNVVLMAKMASGDSVYNLAPALALGAFGNGDMGSLMAMQSMGMGYGQMAPYVGVPQPTYVVLQNTRSLNPNYVWADELGSRYGVADVRLQAMNRAGYSWREITAALVESQQTGQPVEAALYENRVLGTTSEYGYINPIYVPPRRSVRYVSWLPAPRRDWRLVSNPLSIGPVLWVNNGWRTVPVTTSWSRTRVVRQPLYVLESDGDLRRLRYPVYTSGAFRIAALRPRTWFVPQRTVFVQSTSSRYAIHEDWSTGRRAQRFVEPKNYGQIRSAEVHRRNEIRKEEHATDVRMMRSDKQREREVRRTEDHRPQVTVKKSEHRKDTSHRSPRSIDHKSKGSGRVEHRPVRRDDHRRVQVQSHTKVRANVKASGGARAQRISAKAHTSSKQRVSGKGPTSGKNDHRKGGGGKKGGKG